MKKILSIARAAIACVSLVFALTATANADTLDFTELTTTGFTGLKTLSLSNATLTTSDDEFYIYTPFENGAADAKGGICAIGGSNCQAGMEISFTQDIMGLTFQSGSFETGDSATITAFNGATELGSIDVIADMLLDFSGFGVINRLVFVDNDSTAWGISYGGFDFQTVTAVPLPAALPLFGAALTGMGLIGWKRRKSA